MRLNSMKLVIICSEFCITACFNSKRHNIPSIFSKSSVNFINKVWIENANRSLFPISLSKSCRFLMSFALLHGLSLNFESTMTRCNSLGIFSKSIAIQGIDCAYQILSISSKSWLKMNDRSRFLPFLVMHWFKIV